MMKIIEVRDGFVKIESTKKVEISSFLELKGLEKRYVAQVIRTKNNGAGYNIYAKILFVYDGMLKKYDKTLPDNTAEISEFPFNIINNSFDYFNPIVIGKFISDRENILIDSNAFNNSTLVSIDSPENSNIVIRNLANQFKQMGKTVIIDMLGLVNSDDKYVAGRDFKLPLNTESLKFMYEDCLYDATLESKSLIKEIFTDLVEYSNDVKFLPFSSLKTIVDDMVEKSHVFKLLVFKNKLAKFESLGYFASNISDAENLSKILDSNIAILDLSKLDNLFQNRYLSVILSELQNSKTDTRVLIEASNSISKRNIKTLFYSDNILTTFLTHSKFKYLADIKPLFKNYLLENNYTNKNIFNLYSFFIENMQNDNYLIIGEQTNNVPLISAVEKYDVEIKKLPQDSTSEKIIDAFSSAVTTDELPAKDFQEDEILSQYSEAVVENDDSAEVYVSDNNADINMNIESDEESSEESNDDMQANLAEEAEIYEPVKDSSVEEAEEIPEPEGEDVVSDIINDLTDSDDIIDMDLENEQDFAVIDSEIQAIIPDNAQADEEIMSQEAQPHEEFEEDVKPQGEQEDDVEIPQDLALDFEEIEKESSKEEDSSEITEAVSDDSEETPVLPLENQDSELGEFHELEELDIDEEDILVELNDSELQPDEILNNESNMPDSSDELDKDIAEDVDKVFTTIKDDKISDSDLDFIDTLNDFESNENENLISEDEFFNQSDAETLQELDSEEEEGFLEPLEEVSDSSVKNDEQDNAILEKRESATPIVPIYDAEIPEEDMVMSDEIEQGDTVLHAKYGSGVVEKMIKYGNKNLYSINFDNVGRRLLDPTLTEIKKA